VSLRSVPPTSCINALHACKRVVIAFMRADCVYASHIDRMFLPTDANAAV
jgi:hypothetical protein